MKRLGCIGVLVCACILLSSCAGTNPVGSQDGSSANIIAVPDDTIVESEGNSLTTEFFLEILDSQPDNKLTGKIGVFLGDSICAGSTVGEDLPEYRYGWAGLIGVANDMAWKNYGRNGAVITDIPDRDRILHQQVDAVIADFEYVDYFIFQGGSNDADLLRKDPTNLGMISDDHKTFDTQTFTGAFDALLLKIKTAYPNAKIAYIVSPKMGRGPYDSESNYRRQYFDRAVEICKKWKIAYLDLWNLCDMNPEDTLYYAWDCQSDEAIEAGMYYTDGQHLTLKGYLEIAPLIEAFMKDL